MSITFDSEILGDDHYRAVLKTIDGEVDFLVTGRSELLDVGDSYEFGLVSQEGGEPVAFLDSEDFCGSRRTTIRQLDGNGSAFEIEIPRRIPSWPVSRTQVFLGFGALTVLTFVFRQR